MANDLTNDTEERRKARARMLMQQAMLPPLPDSEADKKLNDYAEDKDSFASFGLIPPTTISEKYAAETFFGMNERGDGPRVGDTSALDPKAYSYSYDVNKAMAVFNGKYNTTQSSHICARAVRQAIEAAGVSLSGNPINASDYMKVSDGPNGRSFLERKGFEAVSGGRGGRFDASFGAYQAVVGDVVVIDQPGAPGHIAMLGTDHRWHSDFDQNTMLGGSMFNASNVSFKVFRHNTLMHVAGANLVADHKPTDPPNLVTAAVNSLRTMFGAADTGGKDEPRIGVVKAGTVSSTPGLTVASGGPASAAVSFPTPSPFPHGQSN